jgi:urocanate reductase
MAREGKSTRRGFLKQAGLVTGGAALGSSVFGMLGAETAAAAPIVFDQTADVVILGAGGAGLSAAIEARHAGASVIVLEKAATTGGTTSSSGGLIQAAGTSYQKQYTKFQDDTPAKHAQTWILEGEGLLDDALITDQANGAPANITWLANLGVVFTGLYGACHVPYLDKAGVMADRIHITDGGGAQVAKVLKDSAIAAGATIQTSVEAKSLITDATTGAVIGVKAHGASGDFTVGANKGVVVATSSFDHNNEMAKALSGQQYWDNTSQANFCAPTNTGDGIRMGMQIGAALAGFGGTIDYEFTTGLGGSNASPQIAGVLVNGRAQRFVCEDATYAYIMRAIFQQEAMHKAQVYLVMDSKGVRGKASPWADSAKLAAAVKSGQLVKGTSLLDLANKLKVPAANLKATMADWNRNITRFGKDREYQRNTQLVHINKAPYYAYKPGSANLGSIGGLKIDVDARVIDLNGNPIPHLFAGGMASGGWIGPYYPGSGTAICGAIHWGRKAGASAAKATV